ncbi:GerMN domain-containing protein [Syntrophaceticus schinkii]|jgi:germination protein M|uniref:Putative Spore germination protein-like protein n=1 Tax=Syntrophaceticus schinkii TaxID=499207 RepID=A0A0B7MBK1_9FIRM|nr:GerMN domain-containing protein [Syntrophaceticus schinkii]CEO87879.1 putative Spore germination protein-like protein [Syntrophaceticus schinkii]
MAWDFKRMEEKENERRRGHLHFVLMVVLTVAFLVVGGCSLTERMGTSSKEARTPELEDDILGLEGEDAVFSEEAEGTKVTLYFKNQEENCLVPVTQDVPKVTGIAKATLEALFQGKEEGDLKPALPKGAEVKDLNIKTDGTCVVDLNREATKISGSDPKDEALAVYSIVNTLTEFPTVQKVQILVEGQIIKTFAGHIPVDMPLLRDMSFVKS